MLGPIKTSKSSVKLEMAGSRFAVQKRCWAPVSSTHAGRPRACPRTHPQLGRERGRAFTASGRSIVLTSTVAGAGQILQQDLVMALTQSEKSSSPWSSSRPPPTPGALNLAPAARTKIVEQDDGR